MEEREEWRSTTLVAGYEVSSLGRVRRSSPARGTCVGRVLRPYNSRSGRPCVRIGGKSLYVHTLVATSFLGPRPPGAECRHLDGVKTNNRFTNLLWGTRAENEADRAAHGVTNRGERCGRAKLVAGDVLEVLRRYDSGELPSVIALDLGVSVGTVYRITHGLRWGWLTGRSAGNEQEKKNATRS